MIYLDNAATSWPKPLAVAEEMKRAVNLYGANPGRSGHDLSLAAEERVYKCRGLIAKLFGGKAEDLVFTQNATHGINIGILGSVKKGDHIVISDMEHNAVYRSVIASGCQYSIFKVNEKNDEITVSNLIKELRPNTSLIAVTAAGNLTGFKLPIYKIGQIAKAYNITFLVDASQGAGHYNIDVKTNNINILCASGHKGLLGPQGSGIMLLNDRLPKPLLFGGTGSLSLEESMPDFAPERFEAGTLNTPAIAGLLRGVEYIERVGVTKIGERENALASLLYSELECIDKIKLLGGHPQSSIVAFNLEDKSSEQVASMLNSEGIMVRGGLHCAPLAHKKYGSLKEGAVRVSFGNFNTEEQVKIFIKIIKKLI